MASMCFPEEADKSLALAGAEQQDLFGWSLSAELRQRMKDKDLSYEERMDARQQLNQLEENSVDSDEVETDRFNLSSVDFKAFEDVVPDAQIETRKKIISVLLREHPGRSKQDIIDEVLKLPTDEYSFEYQTRNYRQAYPELMAKLPAYISPKQTRMPGVEPDIRFLPDLEETERARRKLRRYKDDYPRRVREVREFWTKEKIIEKLKADQH